MSPLHSLPLKMWILIYYMPYIWHFGATLIFNTVLVAAILDFWLSKMLPKDLGTQMFKTAMFMLKATVYHIVQKSACTQLFRVVQLCPPGPHPSRSLCLNDWMFIKGASRRAVAVSGVTAARLPGLAHIDRSTGRLCAGLSGKHFSSDPAGELSCVRAPHGGLLIMLIEDRPTDHGRA